MCLILFALDVHPRYRLVLAANRDEFYGRPTAPLSEWEDAPGVFGGRDLQAGGTWLAVNRQGRWAAVTNYRDASEMSRTSELSRGDLVAEFVKGSENPYQFHSAVIPDWPRYGGFNLVSGDASSTCWSSNRTDPPIIQELEPGIYGVSNHLLDTPWPKVERGKRLLEQLVTSPDEPDPDALLDLLLDRAYAADHRLPSTGIPLELERALSAPFTVTPDYGTRSSTALLIGHDGQILIAERRYEPGGVPSGETRLEL